MDYQKYRIIYTLSNGQHGVAYSLDMDSLERYKNDKDTSSYAIHGFNGYSWEMIENKNRS